MRRLTFALLVVATLATGATAQTLKDWALQVDLQASYTPYSGSALRDNLWNVGLFLTGEYRQTLGLAFGYNRTAVRYNGEAEDLGQNSFYGSVRRYVRAQSLPGTLTLRLDGHFIDNDDPTGLTDEGRVIQPIASYLTPDKNYYLDLGYAYSSYKGDLSLHQVTPTLGLALRNQYEWFQFRGYLIFSSNASRTQGESSTTALEAKWYHYFDSPNFFRIHRLQLTGLIGSRIFAVDPDSAAVYNLADMQTGSLSLGALWNLPNGFGIQIFGGYEWFENRDIDDRYTAPYVYLDLRKRW